MIATVYTVQSLLLWLAAFNAGNVHRKEFKIEFCVYIFCKVFQFYGLWVAFFNFASKCTDFRATTLNEH